MYLPISVQINCFCDLQNFENCQPSASNFKSFFLSLEHFFLAVHKNNFGNKIPFLKSEKKSQPDSAIKIWVSQIHRKIKTKCVPMPCDDMQNLIPDGSGECQSLNDASNCDGDNMEMQINPYGIGK